MGRNAKGGSGSRSGAASGSRRVLLPRSNRFDRTVERTSTNSGVLRGGRRNSGRLLSLIDRDLSLLKIRQDRLYERSLRVAPNSRARARLNKAQERNAVTARRLIQNRQALEFTYRGRPIRTRQGNDLILGY